MNKAPFMPFMIDAYITATTHLTTEEHGAYILLLFAMWRRDGSVPDDDKDIARIVGLPVAKWRRVRERLSDKLICDGSTITQKNLQEIWKKTQEKIEKNKQNGARGGRPKASENNDETKANGYDSLKPNESHKNLNQNTLSTKVDKSRRASRLSADWVPNQSDVNEAFGMGLTMQEIDNEAAKFRDYWIAKSGQSATKLDWSATWRNWTRRAVESRGGKAGFPNPVRDDGKSQTFLGETLRLIKERENHGYGG